MVLATRWPWFDIKMLAYQYRNYHCGDKTIFWPSYLHNRISYTGKMTSLYWNRAHTSKFSHCFTYLDEVTIIWGDFRPKSEHTTTPWNGNAGITSKKASTVYGIVCHLSMVTRYVRFLLFLKHCSIHQLVHVYIFWIWFDSLGPGQHVCF